MVAELQAKFLTLQADVQRTGLWVRCTFAGTIVAAALNLICYAIRTAHPAAAAAPVSTGTQSVTVGAASAVAPQRDYMTTEQVAAKEGKSVRTIQELCRQGFVTGAERRGRSYIIAADYRILPPDAAETPEE